MPERAVIEFRNRFQVDAFRTLHKGFTQQGHDPHSALGLTIAYTSDYFLDICLAEKRRRQYLCQYLQMLMGNALVLLYYKDTKPKTKKGCYYVITHTKNLISELKEFYGD